MDKIGRQTVRHADSETDGQGRKIDGQDRKTDRQPTRIGRQTDRQGRNLDTGSLTDRWAE